MSGRAGKLYLTDARESQGRCDGHDEHGTSGEIAGRLYARSERPAGTSYKDGGGGTSDEFSIRSMEVVRTIEVLNPHSCPV